MSYRYRTCSRLERITINLIGNEGGIAEVERRHAAEQPWKRTLMVEIVKMIVKRGHNLNNQSINKYVETKMHLKIDIELHSNDTSN